MVQSLFEYQYGHLNYLTPLLKWRIMDIKSLKEMSSFPKNYYSFCRLVRSMEEKAILKSKRDPDNKKKYVYLTELGERALAGDEGSTCINPETLKHDKWVSEIIQGLMLRGWIHDFKLEHEIKSRGIRSMSQVLIPDAVLYGEKNQVQYSMAFELELNQKIYPRIVEKVRQYAHGKDYDYCLYLFPNPRLLKSYLQVIQQKVSEEYQSQFMLFWGDESTKLEDFSGFALGKEMRLCELFL